MCDAIDSCIVRSDIEVAIFSLIYNDRRENRIHVTITLKSRTT